MPFEEFATGLGAWGILLVTTFAGLYMVTRSVAQQATATAEQDSAFVKLALSQTERVNTLADERVALASSVADLSRRVFSLEIDLGHALRDNRVQGEKIVEMGDEIAALKSKLSTEYQRAEQAETENASLRARVAELESQVRDLEGRIAGLMKERERELQRNIALIEEMNDGEGIDKHD